MQPSAALSIPVSTPLIPVPDAWFRARKLEILVRAIRPFAEAIRGRTSLSHRPTDLPGCYNIDPRQCNRPDDLANVLDAYQVAVRKGSQKLSLFDPVCHCNHTLYPCGHQHYLRSLVAAVRATARFYGQTEENGAARNLFLTAFPVEIIVEIAKHLSPLDLVRWRRADRHVVAVVLPAPSLPAYSWPKIYTYVAGRLLAREAKQLPLLLQRICLAAYYDDAETLFRLAAPLSAMDPIRKVIPYVLGMGAATDTLHMIKFLNDYPSPEADQLVWNGAVTGDQKDFLLKEVKQTPANIRERIVKWKAWPLGQMFHEQQYHLAFDTSKEHPLVIAIQGHRFQLFQLMKETGGLPESYWIDVVRMVAARKGDITVMEQFASNYGDHTVYDIMNHGTSTLGLDWLAVNRPDIFFSDDGIQWEHVIRTLSRNGRTLMLQWLLDHGKMDLDGSDHMLVTHALMNRDIRTLQWVQSLYAPGTGRKVPEWYERTKDMIVARVSDIKEKGA